MMRRGIANVLIWLVYAAIYFLGMLYVARHAPRGLPVVWITVGVLLLVAATLGGLIVHELGHAVAVRLVGGRVSAIYFFSPPARVTIHIGKLPVSFGLQRRSPSTRTPISSQRPSPCSAAK